MNDVAIREIGQLERNVTLGERVYLELRDLLMNGKLTPSEKLSLRSVSEALGVSMMPVREAVSRLVADGALTVLPNRAVCVPLMTRTKLAELSRLRIEIEGYAAEQCAAHRNSEDLERIRLLDKQFRELVRARNADVAKALRINKEFLFAIYRAARSPALVAIIEGLWLKVGPVINLDLRGSQRLASGGAERHHANLVDGIASGHGKLARMSLSEDISESSEFILKNADLPE